MNESKNGYSKSISIAFLSVLFTIIVVVSITIFNVVSLKHIEENNYKEMISSIENIKIVNAKGQYNLVVDSSSKNAIKNASNDKYENFLIKYNENQSNWLNIWLTIMAIALAFIGLIAPICFMKLYEDKKKEMDSIIHSVKKRARESRINVNKIQQKINEIDSKMKEIDKYVREIKSNSLYVEAREKYSNEKYEKAKDLVSEAIKLDKSNVKSFELLGDIYTKLNLIGAAIDAYENAIQIEETDDLYDSLAICYSRRTDTKKALECIEKAINLNNFDDMLLLRKAHILANSPLKENKRRAKEILKNYELKPTASPSILNFLGFIYIKLSELNVAEKHLKNSIKRTSYPSYQYYNLCKIKVKQCDFATATTYLTLYIKNSSKNESFIFDDDKEEWVGKICEYPENESVNEFRKLLTQVDVRKRKGDDFS